MSSAGDADRLARVKLSSAIEPGDLRVTGLVSELGATKVLDNLEAAGDVENDWGFTIGQELTHANPAKLLEQADRSGIRFIIPGDPEWPDRLAGLRGAGALQERGGEPVGLWVRGAHDLRQFAGNAVASTPLSSPSATVVASRLSWLSFGCCGHSAQPAGRPQAPVKARRWKVRRNRPSPTLACSMRVLGGRTAERLRCIR